jgi:hypothetical protein
MEQPPFSRKAVATALPRCKGGMLRYGQEPARWREPNLSSRHNLG